MTSRSMCGATQRCGWTGWRSKTGDVGPGLWSLSNCGSSHCGKDERRQRRGGTPPGASACPFRVLTGARPSLLLFEIWHNRPPSRHLRTVSASKMHATEIAPRPGQYFRWHQPPPIALPSWLSPFRNGARALMNHIHALLLAVCINHVRPQMEPVHAQFADRGVARYHASGIVLLTSGVTSRFPAGVQPGASARRVDVRPGILACSSWACPHKISEGPHACAQMPVPGVIDCQTGIGWGPVCQKLDKASGLQITSSQ